MVKLFALLTLSFLSLTATAETVVNKVSPTAQTATSTSKALLTEKKILTEARASFEQKNFQRSIALYGKIGAESDFWLDAIEERAWTWVRMGQYENALADIKSIESPLWNSQIGPETLLLSTYISLELCQYTDVQKKVERFRDIFLTRVNHLEKIEAQPYEVTKNILTSFPKLEKVSMLGLGKNAEHYPRYFYRDQQLVEMQKNKNLKGFADRLKVLAKRDLAEIEKQLKRVKLIEVEWMQDIYSTAQKNKQVKMKSFSKIDKSKQVQFPITDDEVWLDEVGQYQVKSDRCVKRVAEAQ